MRQTSRVSTSSSTKLKLGVLAALCWGALAPYAIGADQAARIWSGGPILTMNDNAMRAEAIAERDGKIIAVGSLATVMKLKGADTQVIDLDGRALLPGFVDAHGHVMMGGVQALAANVLAPPDGNVKDIASLQKTLREWIEANKETVEKIDLIVGFGYDNATLAELRHPTRDDLDQVSRDVPIILAHQSGHLFAVNSKALAITGITADTPNPEGGVIRRKAGSQEPNGVLEETAGFPVFVKLLSRAGSDSGKTFVKAGSELWAKYGYTTAQEGRSVPGTVSIMQQVADAGDLKVDVVTYPDVLVDRDMIKQKASAQYVNHFRVAGAKLTIDGSPQGFTAWRDRPYYKPVGDYPEGYRGYPAATTDQVVDAIDWAFANDVQILTHANGEAASDLLLSSINIAELKHGADKDRRPVLIHGQFLREEQVDTIKRLNVFPSLFPMHTFYWGDWHTEHTIGPELAPNISPTGWVRQRGMMFSTHHDAPVAFPDSMRVLYATVNRIARGSGKVIGPDQRVDVMTALKAMTIWPAWQHFEEKQKGSLEVGKLADFVVLSQDPTAVDPKTLDQLKVTETIKEGQTVYRMAASQAVSPDFNTFSRVLLAMQGDEHDHGGEACPSEVILQMAHALAAGSP